MSWKTLDGQWTCYIAQGADKRRARITATCLYPEPLEFNMADVTTLCAKDKCTGFSLFGLVG